MKTKNSFLKNADETFISVTSIGKDKPGILNKISKTIAKNKANVELQRISSFAGEYAILLFVSSKTSTINQLMKELEELNEEDLIVRVREYSPASLEKSVKKNAQLIVSGADNPGILEEFTSMLYKNAINIRSLQQNMKHAPNSGAPLFEIRAKITVPEDLDQKGFEQQLENLENELTVDAKLDFPVT